MGDLVVYQRLVEEALMSGTIKNQDDPRVGKPKERLPDYVRPHYTVNTALDLQHLSPERMAEAIERILDGK